MTFDLDMTLKERSKVKFVFTQEFWVRLPLIWAQDEGDRMKTKRAMNWNGPLAGAGGGGVGESEMQD